VFFFFFFFFFCGICQSNFVCFFLHFSLYVLIIKNLILNKKRKKVKLLTNSSKFSDASNLWNRKTRWSHRNHSRWDESNALRDDIQLLFHLFHKRYPFILKHVDIGPCQEKWTSDYLAKKIGPKPVRIHVSQDSMMDFVRKNFTYEYVIDIDGIDWRFFCFILEHCHLINLFNDVRIRAMTNIFIRQMNIIIFVHLATIKKLTLLISSSMNIQKKNNSIK